MFEDTQELAENKLILLYILEKIQLPLSNTLITEIVLENNLLNYFHLQLYLSELAASGFLKAEKEDKRQLYSITPKGENVLEYFENRISKSKKETIKTYLDTHGELLKKEVQVTADYLPGDDKDYIVTCKITEDGINVIDLKLRVSSNEQAKQICTKWKSNPYQFFNRVTSMLTN
jgi:predicted transcriptional regulator